MNKLIEYVGQDNFEYYPNFLTQEESKELFEYLKSQSFWMQHQIKFSDVTRNVPRLVKWFGNMTYKYSGITNPPCKMDEQVEILMLNINNRLSLPLNSCLLNYYRNGNDSISLHKDDERELGETPLIAVISIGGEREFIIKKDNIKEKIKVSLPVGSLFIMKNNFNKEFSHGIDKIKDSNVERISLTYRITK